MTGFSVAMTPLTVLLVSATLALTLGKEMSNYAAIGDRDGMRAMAALYASEGQGALGDTDADRELFERVFNMEDDDFGDYLAELRQRTMESDFADMLRAMEPSNDDGTASTGTADRPMSEEAPKAAAIKAEKVPNEKRSFLSVDAASIALAMLGVLCVAAVASLGVAMATGYFSSCTKHSPGGPSPFDQVKLRQEKGQYQGRAGESMAAAQAEVNAAAAAGAAATAGDSNLAWYQHLFEFKEAKKRLIGDKLTSIISPSGSTQSCRSGSLHDCSNGVDADYELRSPASVDCIDEQEDDDDDLSDCMDDLLEPQADAMYETHNSNGYSSADVGSPHVARGDFTVYECPGLAPHGDMSVSNPVFNPQPKRK